MTINRRLSKMMVCAFIFAVGLAFALVLPILANSQGTAAQSEAGPGDNAPQALTRYYVAVTGTGTTGASWVEAFTNLQDALSAASGPTEIWVAKGVYYPDVGDGHFNNVLTETFLLKDDVALYGGFRFGDTDIDNRDWVKNLTVLSADLEGNDVNTNGVVLSASDIVSPNAFHVLTGHGIGGTAMVDGFTVTAGQAVGWALPCVSGPGLMCDGSLGNCSPTLRNLVFSGNYADNNGGAVRFYCYQGDCSPTIQNVVFTGNIAKNSGGAIYNTCENGTCSPSFEDVVISNNFANNEDGAMRFVCSIDSTCDPRLTDVVVSNNASTNGSGGVHFLCEDSIFSPNLHNVLFSGNKTGEDGGALKYQFIDCYSKPYMINPVFSGNSAGGDGGALHYLGISNATFNLGMTNASFSGNSAGGDGGALYIEDESTGSAYPKISNSILWSNRDSRGTDTISSSIFLSGSAKTNIAYSIVQGAGASGAGSWIPDARFEDGGGNLQQDPLFIWGVNPLSAPSTDGYLGLTQGSPAIDSGINQAFSLPIDIEGKLRVVDGDLNGSEIIDMGAYEFYPHGIFAPILIR